MASAPHSKRRSSRIPSSSAQGQIQRAVTVEVGIIAVAQKKKDQTLVSCVESDLKGGEHAPLDDYRSFDGLKRSTCLDPAFDIVEATVATQAVKFPKRFRIVGDTRSGLGYRDIRT